MLAPGVPVLWIAALLSITEGGHQDLREATRKELLEELGDEFRTQDTKHYLIVHQESARELAWLASTVLEATYERFIEDCARADFSILQPDGPLVCVVFQDEDAWKRYCKRLRLEGRTGGQYDPRSRRIGILDEANRTALPGEKDRTAEQVRSDNIAKVGHEAAHQLCHATELMRFAYEYPLWIREGVACAYQRDALDEPFGLFSDHQPRSVWRLRQSAGSSSLLTLEELVALCHQKVPDTTEELARGRVTYNQSWALVRFLVDTRVSELDAFLIRLNKSAVRPTPDAARKWFFESFESKDRLEAGFDDYIRELLSHEGKFEHPMVR